MSCPTQDKNGQDVLSKHLKAWKTSNENVDDRIISMVDKNCFWTSNQHRRIIFQLYSRETSWLQAEQSSDLRGINTAFGDVSMIFRFQLVFY